MKKKNGRWSMKYDKCISCGTVKIKYYGLGLCSKCHFKLQRPEVREKRLSRQRKYYQEQYQRPEVKEKERVRKKEHNQRPEVKARIKEHNQLPEVKERSKITHKEYYQQNKEIIREYGIQRRKCPEERERRKLWMKEYSKLPEVIKRRKDITLKRLYGISLYEYELILSNQNGKCSICKSKQQETINDKLHVDHDHKTGKVRGLLCSSCNMGLGFFKDDKMLLQSAISYVEGSKLIYETYEQKIQNSNEKGLLSLPRTVAN